VGPTEEFEAGDKMNIGIVGPEARRWTAYLRHQAQMSIEVIISLHKGATIVSGGCPYGGVDIWAEQAAQKLKRRTLIFRPTKNAWKYYKSRNIKIAKSSDILYCVVPQDKNHKCRYDGSPHPTNGGCWTLRYAQSIGKHTVLFIVG
jgi:hypothetical protein